MMTLYYRPDIEIWPFHAYAMENIHYNPYLFMYCQNSRALQETGVKKS